MRLKHALIAAFILFGFILWSCQKEDSKIKTDQSDVGVAKEWWYGNFRKTAEYSSINYTSPLAPPENSSSKKYPDWAKAISYKKYNFDIVEVPLYHITNNVLLPGMQNLPVPEAARIAKSVINKLILIKKADGTTVVRVASVIPSAGYAKKNNYDISNLHPNSLPADFDGYLTIADWGMGVKNFLKIENGKPVKKLRIYKEGYLPKRKTNSTANQRWVCPDPYEVPHMVWVCAVVPTGDAVADQQRCDEIGYWEQMGTVTVYPDCYDDGEEEGGGIEECLNSNTPEFCDCTIWGLGCEPDPDPDPESCNLSVEDAQAQLAGVTTEVLYNMSSENGPQSSPDLYGVVKKPRIAYWEFYKINILPGYNPKYKASFPGVIKNSPPVTNWYWDTISFGSVTQSSGLLPACWSITHTSTVAGPTINTDQQYATAVLSYDFSVNIACLAGLQSEHHWGEVTKNDISVYD